MSSLKPATAYPKGISPAVMRDVARRSDVLGQMQSAQKWAVYRWYDLDTSEIREVLDPRPNLRSVLLLFTIQSNNHPEPVVSPHPYHRLYGAVILPNGRRLPLSEPHFGTLNFPTLLSLRPQPEERS